MPLKFIKMPMHTHITFIKNYTIGFILTVDAQEQTRVHCLPVLLLSLTAGD